MRLDLHVPAAPRKKALPVAKARKVHVVKPCVDPECQDPMGGYIPRGCLSPERRHGFCKACFRRRERGARGKQLKPASKRVPRCIDRDCPHPSGGKTRVPGGKPIRRNGYCHGCFMKHYMRWKRASGAYVDKRRARG